MDYIKYIDNTTNKVIEMSLKGEVLPVKIEGISSLNIDLQGSQAYGIAGSKVSTKHVQSRTINLIGRVIKSLSLNRTMILDTVSDSGRLIVCKNGVEYYLDVEVEQTPDFVNHRIYEEFTMVLYAPFPYWQTVEFVSNSFGSLTKNFRFPFRLEGTFKLSIEQKSKQRTIVNNGNVATGMTVTFSAKTNVTNPEFRDLKTQKFIKFNYVLEPGTVIVATLGNSVDITIIKDDSEINGFRYLTKDSEPEAMYLFAGDNVFNYSADVNENALEINVPAPLGVYRGI